MQFGRDRSQILHQGGLSQTSFLHASQGRLALTAPSAHFPGDAADRRLEHVCQTAIVGRRAVRQLSQWSERFELSESELQILSCLSRSAALGIDQTTLAAGWLFTPAGERLCEKLRARGWIYTMKRAAIGGDGFGRSLPMAHDSATDCEGGRRVAGGRRMTSTNSLC